jgi:P-type Mg2+ transporter
MTRFTWLIIALIALLVPLIFLVNVATRGDWAGAALFALAVGLTPEMLPMIVAVYLVTVQLLKAWLVSRGWID